MTAKEKFGKFVLLDEIDSSGLGTEYRAAKLGPAGLEKIVTVLRLAPSISANAEAVRLLMDQVKAAAQLHSANIVKVLGIGGKVGSPCWISYEFLEGKSLKAVFERCRDDRFPFSIDHGLLIASKIASALEYAQGRATPGAERPFHGFVTPSNVIVSYEGEVRLRGFGYWAAHVREMGAVSAQDAPYLAPEQDAGPGGPKSDIFSVGAILYETLTGERLREAGKPYDPARVANATLQSPTGDDQVPKPVKDILVKSLAADPAARYAAIADMRKAVDALLFSGDFTPTTFNLAFFMHSLFREDIDREAKALKDEREASYAEFVAEEAARPTPPSGPTATVAVPPAVVAAAVAAHSAASASARPAGPPPAAAPHEEPTLVAPPAAGAASPAEAPPPAAAHARDAAAGFTFHKGEPSSSKLPMMVGGGVLVLAIAAGAYFMLARRQAAAPSAAAPATAPTTTLSAEAVAAMARVKELEEKLAAFEAEKAAAAAQAEEDAKKKMEAQARAKGQAVDPAALQRAQEEARKKAEAEQARKQQEEKQRIEGEQRQAEARLAEERRREEEARAAAAAAAAATTLPATTQAAAPPPAAAAPPPTAPALRPGTLVQLSDPGVIAPIPLSTPALQYPVLALRQRVEGKVEVTVLVDERGSVADAKVTSGVGGKTGLNEAALENVRRRRYRPGTKDGVPVRVWVPVTISFVLPR